MKRKDLPKIAFLRPRLLELWHRHKRPEFTLKGEMLAGLTVSLIALPLAIALGVASIPEGISTPLPAPAIGVLTAIIGALLISMLGGSRVQIGGPTAAFIPIIILIVLEHGYMGLLLATMMAGALLIVMGMARMGTLIKFIPWPVTSGFTTGIAVAIMLTQFPLLLGYRAETAMPHHFLERLNWLWLNLPTWNPHTVIVAVACVGIILWWPRLRITWLPGAIVALIAGTLWVSLMDWESGKNVATIASRFGSDALPKALPTFTLPEINLELIRSLIGPALAIALLGAIESLLSAVVADGLSNDRHDSNTELIAQGLTNLICPLFGGLPITGAIARTSSNINNGGRTPLAGIFSAIFLFLIVWIASPLAMQIPLAAIAAVLVAVALRMGEWHVIAQSPKLPLSDAMVLFTTFGLTVVFDLVIAVEVGMVLAAILFIKRVAETTEVKLLKQDDMLIREENIIKKDAVPDGVLIYRIFGPFLFGAAEKMEDALQRVGQLPKVLILDLHLVSAIDATGMHALTHIVDRMKKRGNTVIISGIHRQPLLMLRKANFIHDIGRRNFCATLADSLDHARELLAKGSNAKY